MAPTPKKSCDISLSRLHLSYPSPFFLSPPPLLYPPRYTENPKIKNQNLYHQPAFRHRFLSDFCRSWLRQHQHQYHQSYQATIAHLIHILRNGLDGVEPVFLRSSLLAFARVTVSVDASAEDKIDLDYLAHVCGLLDECWAFCVQFRWVLCAGMIFFWKSADFGCARDCLFVFGG